jgi:hypothetical protein
VRHQTNTDKLPSPFRFQLLNLLQQQLGLTHARELLPGGQQLFKLFASLNIIA